VISIGRNNREEGAMETIFDAEEIIPHEIWRLKIRSGSYTYSIYVLEATCETIGRSSAVNSDGSDASIQLRIDWSTYIRDRVDSRKEGRNTDESLLSLVQWTNHEEYDKGISQLWLTKVNSGGDEDSAKLIVARRYILACVVGNR